MWLQNSHVKNLSQITEIQRDCHISQSHIPYLQQLNILKLLAHENS